MPCYQSNNVPSGYGKIGTGGFATEADCLNACKEGACCNGTTCSVKPQCQCNAAAGEVFKGIGTVCSPNPCLPCPCSGDEFYMPESVTFSIEISSASASSITPCASVDVGRYVEAINSLSTTIFRHQRQAGEFTPPGRIAEFYGSGGINNAGNFDSFFCDLLDSGDQSFFGSTSSNPFVYVFCDGQVFVSPRVQFSGIQIYSIVDAETAASGCASNDRRFLKWWAALLPSVNASVSLQAVPPCDGETTTIKSGILSGAGLMSPFDSPCDLNFIGINYPFFDIQEARIVATFNYANPLP